MAKHHRNQWTSTKAEDRAKAEAKDMAEFDFKRGAIASEKNLWRMADGHVFRFNLNLKGMTFIAGVWAKAYLNRIAELEGK